MSKKGNETIKTVTVAGLLCLICSIIVSSIVVSLRPKQAKNAELDMKKNILSSAGMLTKDADVNALFDTLDTMIIDLETGKQVTEVEANSYNQVEAVKNPKYSVNIPADKDVANLKTRSKYAKVYLKKNDAGNVETVILAHWGKGLWSTMYGYIALGGEELNTIRGFAYYAQGETPGLGGEVDNPSWKKQWIGKKVYGEEGLVKFKVAKAESTGKYAVDGLSGATITANGVSSSMKYWFGSHGYKQAIQNLKTGEI